MTAKKPTPQTVPDALSAFEAAAVACDGPALLTAYLAYRKAFIRSSSVRFERNLATWQQREAKLGPVRDLLHEAGRLAQQWNTPVGYMAVGVAGQAFSQRDKDALAEQWRECHRKLAYLVDPPFVVNVDEADPVEIPVPVTMRADSRPQLRITDGEPFDVLLRKALDKAQGVWSREHIEAARAAGELDDLD